jgi:protoporphyrinogen IX oxidase
MLWIKALHIGFVVCWFSGLFYLPRIFVNLAMTSCEDEERARLLLMARKLYRFMQPLALLALVFGVWLWLGYGIGRGATWMHAKLALITLLIIYHFLCGHLLRNFEKSTDQRTHVWYRWFNEAPVLLLFSILVLVVVKPF